MTMRMLCFLRALLLMPQGLVDGQSIEDMMTKMQAESEARAVDKMAAQLHMMMGEAPGGDQAPPSPDLAQLREDPRRPKQIGVKTAKAFMREALAVLSTGEALAALEAARADIHPSHEDYWHTLTISLGPALERLTREVVQKYAFAGDFEQAISSVGDAQKRKGDKELTEAIEQLNDIFTGESSLAKSAALKELEALAATFLNQDKLEQEQSLALSESILEGAAGSQVAPHAKEYLEAMQAVYRHGPAHVQNTIAEMIADAKEDVKRGKRATLEERERFDLRMGVLLKFLPPEERQKLLEPDDDAKAPPIEL